MHFWPDESFFDSPRFSASRLSHLLKAKAVLCPGVEIIFKDKVNDTEQTRRYADGLTDYLSEAVNGLPLLPENPLSGRSPVIRKRWTGRCCGCRKAVNC